MNPVTEEGRAVLSDGAGPAKWKESARRAKGAEAGKSKAMVNRAGTQNEVRGKKGVFCENPDILPPSLGLTEEALSMAAEWCKGERGSRKSN